MDSFVLDAPVYRTKPLPQADINGTFIVSAPIIEATKKALTSFALLGLKQGGHEGLCYWAGRELGSVQVFSSVIIPRADHGPQRVMVSKEEVGRAAHVARSMQLGILCQVHSHPGSDARHSDGDDNLILLPFEGMLSVVAPHYGTRIQSVDDFSFHQYQNGRWVLCTPRSVREQVAVVPTLCDLRI